MITTPLALRVFDRMTQATDISQWIIGKENRGLTAKVLLLIRKKEGRQAAVNFVNTLYSTIAVLGDSP